MTNRKSRSDRQGEHPESEGPLHPDQPTRAEEITPPEGFVTPEDSIPPEDPRDAKIPPEDMPPLDAERVGPDPDPDAAEGLKPDATIAAGTGTDPAAHAARETSHPQPDSVDAVSPTGAAPENMGATPAAPPPERGRPKRTGENGLKAEDPAGPPPFGAEATGPVSSSATDDMRPGGKNAANAEESGTRNDHEEGGRSIAATLLFILLLLVAGAALGIWAAPQLAPRLPSGMAPVAAWLSPRDSEIEARLGNVETETAAASETLRAEVAMLREELAAATAAGESADGLDARLTELENNLGQRVEALSQELSSLDGGETRQRISQLEAGMQGIEETLASFRDQLSQAEAAGDDSAEINAYQAEVEGLRGQMQAVAGQVGQLSRRIDEVAAEAQQQVDLARTQVAEVEAEAAQELSQAQTEAALAQIRSSLEAGAPYNEPIALLASQPDGVPVSLMNPAIDGVATLQELRSSFPEAANAAIRASIQSRAEDGFLNRLRGFAESQIASRSLEPRSGTDADAVLSRMEDALRQNDLATALSEAEALSPAASEAMSEWLNAAQTRQNAVESFEALQAELSATN